MSPKRNTATRSTPAAPAAPPADTAPAADVDTPNTAPDADGATPAPADVVATTPPADAADADTTPPADTPPADGGTTPPADAPATPPATPRKPVDVYVDAFYTYAAITSPDAADADTPPTPAEIDTATNAMLDAYHALPGGARGGARAAGMRTAIRGGVDGGHAIDADERVPVLLAARGGDTPDPIAIAADRLLSLLHAVHTAPLPGGVDRSTVVTRVLDAMGIPADASAASMLDTPAAYTPTDGVRAAATRAVDAITRGSGTRGPVDRLPLAQCPDGALTYSRPKTKSVWHATLRGGVITTADGSTFTDTTPAAVHVNGGTSVNGWTAWRYVGGSHDGQTLHAVSTAHHTAAPAGDTPADAPADAADADGGTADA